MNGTLSSASSRAEKSSAISNIEAGQQTNTSTRTDYSRWRLLDERGRQTWQYLETDEAVENWPQSTADKYFLGLPTVGVSFRSIEILLKLCRTCPTCQKQRLPWTP
jgi:lanosterol synthase